MIGFLQGVVIQRQDTLLTLFVGGVGYEVHGTLNALTAVNAPITAKAGADSESVSLWIHHVVREDAQQLYGFADQAERTLFRELIRISGIGPKVAVAILSGMDSDGLVRAIQQEDAALLTKIPGIGKKTAERLVVEMKDRVQTLNLPESHSDAQTAGIAESSASGSVSEEAESALISLGYKPAEAARMLSTLDAGVDDSVESLIRRALRNKLAP